MYTVNDLVRAGRTPQEAEFILSAANGQDAAKSILTPGGPNVAPAESPVNVRVPRTSSETLIDTLQRQLNGQEATAEDARKQQKADIERIITSRIADIEQATGRKMIDAQREGERALAESKGINIRSGLAGSSFGAARNDLVREKNEAVKRALEEEANLKKGTVYADAQSAYNDIENRYREKLDSIASGRSGLLIKSKEFADADRKKAEENLATLAKSGKVSLDSLKRKNENGDTLLDVLAEQTGRTPQDIELSFLAQQPDETILDKFRVGDKFYIVSRDAVGKVNRSEIDLPGLPVEYKHSDLLKNGKLVLWDDNGNTKVIGGMPQDTTDSTLVGDPNVGGGDAYLKTLDPGTASLVKKVANYEMDISKVTSLRSGEREQLAKMVSQYDPTFDMTQYGARSAVRKDFTSGKAAQNIRSLNTAVGHLDSLSKAGAELENAGIPLWNKIANFTISAVGDPRVVKFLNAANAVESEMAAVFKGTGATDQEIKVWRENLNENQSPEQLNQSIQMLIELMGSRMAALQSQYETGLGKPKDFQFLNDKSRAILTKIGTDPNSIDPVNGGDTTEDLSGVPDGTIVEDTETGKRGKVVGGKFVPD